MTNKPKMQGTRWETQVVTLLKSFIGVRSQRRIAEGGLKDIGDITWKDYTGSVWIGECKATQTLNATRVLGKARVKSPHPKTTVLFWKRLTKLKGGQKKRTPDGEAAVVVMGLDTFRLLMESRD